MEESNVKLLAERERETRQDNVVETMAEGTAVRTELAISRGCRGCPKARSAEQESSFGNAGRQTWHAE